MVHSDDPFNILPKEHAYTPNDIGSSDIARPLIYLWSPPRPGLEPGHLTYYKPVSGLLRSLVEES